MKFYKITATKIFVLLVEAESPDDAKRASGLDPHHYENLACEEAAAKEDKNENPLSNLL